MFGKFGLGLMMLETMKGFNNLAYVLLVPHHPVWIINFTNRKDNDFI